LVGIVPSACKPTVSPALRRDDRLDTELLSLVSIITSCLF
jgi:hypothetical protein